jgi:hypothetical protein
MNVDRRFTIIKRKDDIANRDAIVLHGGQDLAQGGCLTSIDVSHKVGEVTTVVMTYLAREVNEWRLSEEEFNEAKEQYDTRPSEGPDGIVGREPSTEEADDKTVPRPKTS